MMFALFKKTVVAAFQHLLTLLSRDVTDSLPPGDVLVIAPHPDDETLGCGAVIARLTQQGRKVRIVIATDGSASSISTIITPAQLAAIRKDELKQAMASLGVPADNIVVLAHPDGEAPGHIPAMAADLARVIGEVKPGLIFAPSGRDKTPDHRAVAKAVTRALNATQFKGVVYEYPVWFWPVSAAWMLLAVRPLKTLRKVQTAEHLAAKRNALAQHRSQLENLTGEAGWLMLDEAFTARFLRPHEIFFERDV